MRRPVPYDTSSIHQAERIKSIMDSHPVMVKGWHLLALKTLLLAIHKFDAKTWYMTERLRQDNRNKAKQRWLLKKKAENQDKQ